MSTYSKQERVWATLAGAEPDRTPVAAWGHLLPAEKEIDSLAEATLHFMARYDWDWIKLNPRATYFAEAWGNRYDFEDYNGVFPRLVVSPFGPKPDLTAIRPVSATGGSFGDHLRLIRKVREGAPEIPLIQTIFTPLSVLSFLIGHSPAFTQAEMSKAQHQAVKLAVREQPEAVHGALAAITETLAAYAAETLNVGTDGIFLAITGLAREEVLSRTEYETFGKPYDLKVLQAVEGARFNTFHICGDQAYLEAIADLPVAAVSWAAEGHGNPDLSQARTILGTKTLIGGVDEKTILLKGGAAEVEAQARKALALGGKTRFLLAPGCSVDPATPQENLQALRRVVD